MSEEDVSPRAVRQILVAFDTAAPSLALLESAVALAAALELELHGLFVEDTDLLRIAELPFAREVALSTAMERQLNGLHVARSLRAVAAEVRQNLAEVADRAQVRWTFKTVRGSRIRPVLAAAETSDLLILNRSQRSSALRSIPVTAPIRGRPVVFFYDSSPEAQRALAVLGALVRHAHPEVVVVTTEKADVGGVERELTDAGVRPIYRRVPQADMETVLQLVKVQPPGLLVLPAETALMEQVGKIQALLDSIDCPMWLVR